MQKNTFWDKFKKYDSVNLLPGYRKLLDSILNLVDCEGSILDAGCGTGNLLEHLPNRKIIGVDESDIMLDKAKMKIHGRKNISLKKSDITSLGFKNNSFELVISVNVLYNLDKPTRALREFYRVLKSKGKLIISSPLDSVNLNTDLTDEVMRGVKEKDRKKVLNLINSNKELIQNGGMKFAPSMNEIKEMIIGAGFKILVAKRAYYNNNYLIKAIKE